MKIKKIMAIMTAAMVMTGMAACSNGSGDYETTGAEAEDTTTAATAESDETETPTEATESEGAPEMTEDQTVPDTTAAVQDSTAPATAQGIVCYGEANDANSKVYPLMGREHWCVEDAGVDVIGHHSWKFVDLDTGEVIGECFGFYDAPDAYIVDIDGDGVYELLCNAQYGADMAFRALIYRDNNGQLEMGDFDSCVYEDATGVELWGAANYDIVYEPGSSALYIIDKGNESRTEIGLKYYAFYDYEYVEY